MATELLTPPTVETIENPVEFEEPPDMVCHAYYREVLWERATSTLCGIRWQDDPHVMMHGGKNTKSPGAFNPDDSCSECGAPLCSKCKEIANQRGYERQT